MSKFEFCERNCNSGATCFMPADVKLAFTSIDTSIEAHVPQRIDYTSFGANLGSYCLHMAKYQDTLTEMTSVFIELSPMPAAFDPGSIAR